MDLRIEYVLLLSLAILFGFILMEQPVDIKAIESNSSKEIYFKNLALIDLNEEGIENQLLSSSLMKSKDSFEFEDINVTYKKNHNILAERAMYREGLVHMEGNVSLRRSDGFSFITDDLVYNMDDKVASTKGDFRLDINESRVSGENLYYNLDREEVKANTIRANISF